MAWTGRHLRRGKALEPRLQLKRISHRKRAIVSSGAGIPPTVSLWGGAGGGGGGAQRGAVGETAPPLSQRKDCGCCVAGHDTATKLRRGRDSIQTHTRTKRLAVGGGGWVQERRTQRAYLTQRSSVAHASARTVLRDGGAVQSSTEGGD